ncbi:ribonuclease HII [Methylomagnum ishizawai]|uniref:ribonuclease HII n=1 Tax=Methylomagnum ishizawai TaxID=1760988 RepID=UPI001C326585|nr:ribonuclease HII [Methylomagnum ishizawai]BBL74524.1 ribonuclease HII [Methylomagnum ishizawai]
MDASGPRLIAGLDEVGRGCIAGPVIAAVVVFPEGAAPFPGLADSKKLTPKRRAELARRIEAEALAYAIGRAEAPEIDRINILQATFLAMRRAYAGLGLEPDEIRVDGDRRPPGLPRPCRAIVGGDAIEPTISAASILAKVFRDREMEILDGFHPGYGFAIHKGYPTPAHQAALRALGISPVHRRSFGPVARAASLF